LADTGDRMSANNPQSRQSQILQKISEFILDRSGGKRKQKVHIEHNLVGYIPVIKTEQA